MEKLVKEAKSGKIRALEELIHINEIKMYKTAKTILSCDDDVNEAIQLTIISVYENITKLKNNKFFSTWMMKILINNCKKIWNQNAKNNKIIEPLEENELVQEDNEDYSFVSVALNKLEKDFREIAILYYYDEFSIKEISKILDLPIGTVKSRLSRTRDKLKVLIRKEVEQNG